MAAKSLSHDEAKIGMRVQDYWGRCGTIRWIGKLDKKDAPNKEAGRYYGIEYDDTSCNPLRCNGTFKGKKYFECEEGHGMMCRTQDFYPEMNPGCIAKVRAHFGDRVKTWHDFELVKFCIARQFDMNKVYEMIDKHLKWREEFQPNPDEYFPQDIVDDYPCGYSGTTDYDDNLIYCERPTNGGHCHPSDFVQRVTLPVIARWHAAGMEMGIRRMRATDYHCKRVCYFVDLLNVQAMTRPMIGFAQTLATVEQDNYPENLGRVFITNCPAFFRFAWKLVKIFIDDRTNKKINFCATGKAVEATLPFMPESEIPNFCGGTSNKWMETNGGIIGSTDPSKAYKGPTHALPGTTSEDMETMQREVSTMKTPMEVIEGDDTPTPSQSGRSPTVTPTTATECSPTQSPQYAHNSHFPAAMEGSVKEASVKETSVKESSVKETSVKETSVKEGSMKEASVKGTSGKESSAKAASVKESSVKADSSAPASEKKSAKPKGKEPAKANGTAAVKTK